MLARLANLLQPIQATAFRLRTRSPIFAWLKVIQHSRWQLRWLQTRSQKWRNYVKPCHQSSSKKLLETCIALDWMARYKRIAEIWKHLDQNRSPSSLHGKQHKLTKSQQVVLHFTMLPSLGQSANTEWKIMWITCADRHLIDHDCAKIWLQKPGLWGDPLFKSCAWPIGSVLLQANCTQSSSTSSPD